MSKDVIPTKNNFDFLRWILAFSVVIFHLIVLTGNNNLKPVARILNGDTAVCGFFIISGFLITRSWILKKDIKKYAQNRMRRLLPAYLSVLIISSIVFSLLSKLSMKDYFSSNELMKYLISNIFFLNFLNPSLPGVFETNSTTAINGSLWTIKVEVMFYTLVPLIVLLLTYLKKNKAMNIALLAIYCSAYIYRLVCNFIAVKYNISIFNELGHQLPGYMNYFSTGIFLYINYEAIKKIRKETNYTRTIAYFTALHCWY